MAKYDEIEVIQRAYDELKCLDPAGVDRALEWLRDRFTSDHEKARKERQQATRDRISAKGAGK